MTKRPTLVFLHGHGVSPVIWNLLHSSLSNDYAIVRPDLSRLTDTTTTDAYADELYSQLSSSEVGACVLIGHSMGGYVALAIAEKYPDRVKGLVLFNSTAFADPDTDEQRQKRQEAQDTLESRGSKPFIEKAIPMAFSEEHRTSLANEVKQLVEQHSNLPKEALLAGLQAIRTRPDRSDLLANADFPVLIIAGKADELLPLAGLEKLKEKTPNAQFAVLEHSGHLGMVEEPEASLLALKPFLNGIDVES